MGLPTMKGRKSKGKKISDLEPQGVIIEDDLEEKEFVEFVKLWRDGKMSYKSLVEKYPDHEKSMISKLLYFILEKFD